MRSVDMGLLSRNGGLLATPNLAIHPLPNPTGTGES